MLNNSPSACRQNSVPGPSMSDDNQTMKCRGPIPVLYEDDQLIAVAKPSGMFVHRSMADRSATEFVVQTVRDQLNCFVYPIHRLDRPTSGLLLLAKSSEAAAIYATMFAERRVQKTYLALVRGFTEDSGRIDRPLVSDKGLGRPASDPHSVPQEAETLYRTLEKFEVGFPSGRHATTRCSLVEASPRTGRYHQIRRHLVGISHPVIGDADHGDTKINGLFQHHVGVTRLMLAAVRIEFAHPMTDASIVIECPPDDSFSTVIRSLRTLSLPAVPD